MVLAMKQREKRKSETERVNGVSTAMKKKRWKEEEELKADQPAAEEEEVADEEVEEFFAILRRIHAAVKYFGKGGSGSAGGSGSGRKVIQAIGRQCSEEINGVLDEKKREDDENRGFDLNALPNDGDT